jgi:uncharacterized RDD family membrane protein YckC
LIVEDPNYAGFWIRTGAAILDSVLILIVIGPLLTAIYGSDYWLSPPDRLSFWHFLLNYILPAFAIILFWIYRSATPGKMLLKLRIIDAKTGGKPTNGQLLARYLGYYVSTLPLMLGIIWVGVDKRKQGWHDKLAGTLVIREETPEK